jgi:4-hydroxyphenylpyruvate dioxygenase-like putative hemolysin
VTDVEAPPPFDFRLDHICVAVRRIATARAALERTVGYVARTEPVENTRQQVIVQFMRKPGSIDIKLIEPSTPESPLVEFLRRTGGGLHHVAFRTGSVPEAVAELELRGARVVTRPEPGEAFDNGLIAFAFLGPGLHAEFIDSDARRGDRP